MFNALYKNLTGNNYKNPAINLFIYDTNKKI